jgi:hypothetical protein
VMHENSHFEIAFISRMPTKPGILAKE